MPPLIFLLKMIPDSNHSKCNSPGDCCWPGKGPGHTLINSSPVTGIRKSTHSPAPIYMQKEEASASSFSLRYTPCATQAFLEQSSRAAPMAISRIK